MYDKSLRYTFKCNTHVKLPITIAKCAYRATVCHCDIVTRNYYLNPWNINRYGIEIQIFSKDLCRYVSLVALVLILRQLVMKMG